MSWSVLFIVLGLVLHSFLFGFFFSSFWCCQICTCGLFFLQFSSLTRTLTAFLESFPWNTYKCLNQIVTSWKRSWIFLPWIVPQSNQSWQEIWRKGKRSTGRVRGGKTDIYWALLCSRLCPCIFSILPLAWEYYPLHFNVVSRAQIG